MIEWHNELIIELPKWLRHDNRVYISDRDKALKAIELSKLNVINNTGGVFGAAIFDIDGQVISQGVNVVVPGNNSVCHAEIMAIMFAENRIKYHSLSGYILATSSEPCAMCQAAIVWADLDKVIYSASSKDVEKIGFDEGDKPSIYSLKDRGIDAIQTEKELAIEVLNMYGGDIYNGKTR